MFTEQELNIIKQIIESSTYRGADARLIVKLLDKIDTATTEPVTKKE